MTANSQHWNWDPNPVMFHLPGIGWPITWYGPLFAIGLYSAYWLFAKLDQKPVSRGDDSRMPQGQVWREKLFLWIFFAIIAGARAAEILFYGHQYYAENPAELLKVWRGGLASHGTLVSIPLAVWGFCRYHASDARFAPLGWSWIQLLDRISLSAFPCLTAIRIGNWFNQEVAGLPTQVPWAVILLHPNADDGLRVPRHPVQLYEAVYYLIVGAILWTWRKRLLKERGIATGAFLLLFLGGRALCERFKAPIGDLIWPWGLSTGQALSLPGMAVGIYLLTASWLRRR